MKQGKTLIELAQEVQRQAEAKKDIVADSKQIKLSDDAQSLVVEGNDDVHQFDAITPVTHGQISQHLKIPKAYYDRMKAEKPALLAQNVNEWLHSSDSRRMVRTLDGTARAFLSDRYRRIDNNLIAETALQTLLNMPGIDPSAIASCEITDRRLYLKVIFDQIRGEVVPGDIMESGITISNSEIGQGGLVIAPFANRCVCSNGMAIPVDGLNKRHIGTRLQNGVITYQDDTIKADDKALMLEFRDTLLASADQEQFNKYLDLMRDANEGAKIERPVEAVEVLANTFNLNDGEKNSVLENLIMDQNYSRWGALNAVTKVANDHLDYDRASELEALGGRILTLTPSEWQTIATAA